MHFITELLLFVSIFSLWKIASSNEIRGTSWYETLVTKMIVLFLFRRI